MKLISDRPFVNLEEHLDMDSFGKLEDRISFLIAKHSENLQTSSTTQDTLFDKTKTIFVNDIIQYKKDPRFTGFTDKQLEWYSKLNGGLTLGSHLLLRSTPGYPASYSIKHMGRFAINAPWANEFDFLFDWIKDQKCFNDFGRVIFWVNEPNQKTAWHRDYPENPEKDLDKRDPFIWITGRNKKRLLLKDTATDTDYVSDCRALTFNSTNPHCSLGNELHTSWSLRIDGMFNKEWATKAGIAEYFNVV